MMLPPIASTINGGPSPLPLSLISGLPEISTQSVEVGNSRLRCGRGVPRGSREKLIPAPSFAPYSATTSSPRGSHPEGTPLVGMGAAPAASLASWTREASGHRPGGTTAPVRGARWTGRRHHAFVPCRTARQPDEGNWRRKGSRRRLAFDPISAARSPKSPTSGAPRGVRMVAQSIRAASWLNGCGLIPNAPRGAPLPLVCYACVRARAGIWCVRHSRAKPSGPAFGRPKDRLRADPRISGR